MIAILATHPIQYQVPIWQQLFKVQNVPFEVWYLTAHGVKPSIDKEFGRKFSWDLDMLSGYPHRFSPEPVPQQLRGFWHVGLPSDFRERLRSGDIKSILVHGWNVRACWEAVFLAHKLGVQVWIRGESNDLKHDAFWKKLIKRLLLGAFFRRVDRFLVIGVANRRLYESYGIKASKLVQAPYAVDNKRFRLQATSLRPYREILRRNWGITEGAFCVLFVGKLIPKKRPTDLIAALNVLKKTLSPDRNYHALFVGSGEMGAELRSRCRVVHDAEARDKADLNEDEMKPIASFAGFMNQTEISKAYVAADALVLPSDSNETWGLVVNEAMASGLPCIVSDACGSAEDLVVPIDSKTTFPMGDHTALAKAIKHLSEQPIARQTVLSHIAKYDFDVTVKTIEKLWIEG